MEIERRKEIGGNVDYERFQKEVLLPLKKKETVLYQPFHCQTMQLQEKVEMPFRKLNLIENGPSRSYFRHSGNWKGASSYAFSGAL